MGVGLLVHLVLFIDIEEIIVLVLVSWKVNLKRTREKSDHSPLVYWPSGNLATTYLLAFGLVYVSPRGGQEDELKAERRKMTTWVGRHWPEEKTSLPNPTWRTRLVSQRRYFPYLSIRWRWWNQTTWLRIGHFPWSLPTRFRWKKQPVTPCRATFCVCPVINELTDSVFGAECAGFPHDHRGEIWLRPQCLWVWWAVGRGCTETWKGIVVNGNQPDQRPVVKDSKARSLTWEGSEIVCCFNANSFKVFIWQVSCLYKRK